MSKPEQKFMHNLEINKIAFVDRPANKSEFLLFKAEDKIDKKDKGGGDKMSKELTKELKELLKSRNYSDEQIEEIEKAKYSEEELKALEKMAKMLPKVIVEKKDDVKKKDDIKKKDDVKDNNDVKKDDIPTLVAMRKDLDDERARGNKLEKDLLIEKEHRVQDVYLSKAASLPFIPLKKSQLAGMIRFVSESDQKDDFKKAFVEMLASVNSLVKQASVFQEVGRSGSSSLIATASDELISKAQKRIAKGEAENMSLDEVVAELIKEDPALYEDHLGTFPDAGEDLTDE